MSQPVRPDDYDPLLAQSVERLTLEQIHFLPFGAIRLDQSRTRQVLHQGVSPHVRPGDRPVLGFFRDIAPCMDVDHYR